MFSNASNGANLTPAGPAEVGIIWETEHRQGSTALLPNSCAFADAWHSLLWEPDVPSMKNTGIQTVLETVIREEILELERHNRALFSPRTKRHETFPELLLLLFPASCTQLFLYLSLQTGSWDITPLTLSYNTAPQPCILTQMSHLPGKNLSGMRAAYRAAPVMYRQAMRANQPICPIVAALRSPSEMTKCRVGMTPLRPRATNTPGDNKTDSASDPKNKRQK